jgi:hypothetical protein
LVAKLLDGNHTIENRLIVPSVFVFYFDQAIAEPSKKSYWKKKGFLRLSLMKPVFFKNNEANDLNFILNAICTKA